MQGPRSPLNAGRPPGSVRGGGLARLLPVLLRLVRASMGLLAPLLLGPLPPVGSAAAAPLAPQPLGPSLQQSLQLPDWIELGLDLSAEPLLGKDEADALKGAWMQQLVLTTRLSSGLGRDRRQWREIDHWAFDLQLTGFSGDPNLARMLGAAFPLQTDAHPTGLWLTAAALERRAAAGELSIKAGVIPLNPGFVQAPVLNSYVHSVLNNTLNLETVGLPINPYAAPGVMVQARLGQGSELRFGQFWLEPVQRIAGLFGVNPGQPTISGSLQIVQWSLHDLPGAAASRQPLRHRQQLISRQLPDPLLQIGGYSTAGPASNRVVYGLLTLVAPVPVGLDHRLWFGFNRGLDPANNPSPQFLSGGWLAQGLLPGRPLDVLAIAYGRTSFSQLLTPELHPESVIELNYTIPLSSQLSVQPVVQWILQPDGRASRAPLLAGGVQLSLSF